MTAEKVRKKKKQHYVPQCYLEAWAIPRTHQIHVFDKKNKKPRINNITDVAQERYFYDIDFVNVFSEEEQKARGMTREELSELSDEQYFENYFSERIEGKLSSLLNMIISKVDNLTPSKQRLFHFTSRWNKARLSYQLSIQYFRTKATRNAIIETSDCIQQMLQDMNASKQNIEAMQVTKEDTKLIHGRMLGNEDVLKKTAAQFNSFIWILGINNTDKPFYTSDKPIGVVPHVRNGFVSMSGIKSEGVEFFYPISPKIILVMYEKSYHTRIAKYDRHYIQLNNPEVVEYYNYQSIMQSERCVFSQNSDFSLIERILQENENAFSLPNVSLTWGGKTYFPRREGNSDD